MGADWREAPQSETGAPRRRRGDPCCKHQLTQTPPGLLGLVTPRGGSANVSIDVAPSVLETDFHECFPRARMLMRARSSVNTANICLDSIN